MSFNTEDEIYQFQGKLLKLSHLSLVTNTKMNVNVFLPPSALEKSSSKTPVLIYLSGLTCTPDNASEKSFLQYFASKFGFAMLFPDTSPRGDIPDEDAYDFGIGAGFYVDATQEPWLKNYNMFSYVHKELLTELSKFLPQLDFEDRISITGHSMGGYGALSGFFSFPGKYKSVSAFAPIANPLTSSWGINAFGKYLGEDKTSWYEYDPSHLVKEYKHENQPDILIHQGSKDNFYVDGKLQPENFVEAAKEAGYKGKVNLQLVEGYNHLYFFISSFAEEHAKHHAKFLGLHI